MASRKQTPPQTNEVPANALYYGSDGVSIGPTQDIINMIKSEEVKTLLNTYIKKINTTDTKEEHRPNAKN